MDFGERGTTGSTQLVVDNSIISTLHNDDRDIRSNETGMMARQYHPSDGKSLKVSCAEARVVKPRDDEEMQRLNSYFANLNPKSPMSPPNLDVHSKEKAPFSVKDQLDGKPRSSLQMMKTNEPHDARCNPRAIPQTTTQACHPTDSHAPAQPSDVTYMYGSRRQPSQVQVVTSQTEQKQKLAAQIQKLAKNYSEPEYQNLIQKIMKQYQKSKGIVPVAPDNDIENRLGNQKEKLFRVKVVEDKVEEDMAITISSDNEENFCDIRNETRQTQRIVVPQQEELTPLNCQPSDASEITSTRLALPRGSLSGQNYLRTHEFLKGCVLPGTHNSMCHLLGMYGEYPAELAIGCHGILLSQDNVPTDLGEYDEVDEGKRGYTFLKIAGRGSYGSVKLCRDNFTKKEFVKKEIFKVDILLSCEVRMLSELSHRNIAGLYGFILRDNCPEILLEYAGVSLLEYTCLPKCPEDLDEKNIIEMLYQGLSGLEYLDQRGVIHYDIKPENICILKVSNGIVLKITDFGSAKKVTEAPDFHGCTVEYLSPELAINLITSKYQSRIPFGFDVTDYVMTPKSDVYSLALSIMFIYRKGHVVISLFNQGNMTYHGLDQANIQKTRQIILLTLAKTPAMVKNTLIPDEACSEMKAVLRDMVEECPSTRPTAKQMKETVDDLLRRPKTPTQVPVFLSAASFTEEKRISLNRQLSSRNSSCQETSYRPIRQYIRKMSRDQSSLPYGYTSNRQQAQKMDTSDIQVVPVLQGMVPNFPIL